MRAISIRRSLYTSLSIKSDDLLAAADANPESSLVEVPLVVALDLILLTDLGVLIELASDLIWLMRFFTC